MDPVVVAVGSPLQKQKQNMKRSILAWLFSLLLAGSADALSATPSFLFDVDGGTLSRDLYGYGTGTSVWEVDSGGHSYEVYEWKLDAAMEVEGIRVESWEITLKEDPYVVSNMYVTNTTTSDQVFFAGTFMSIPSFAYDEVVFSSLGVSATDSNGDGNLYFGRAGSGPDNEIYDGKINGVTALAMDPDNPWSLPLTVADCGGPGCSAVSSNYVASKAVTGGLATSIGLDYRFTLSPGDSAAVTGRFEIIPEPGTGLLLGLGLVGLGWRRARKIH